MRKYKVYNVLIRHIYKLQNTLQILLVTKGEEMEQCSLSYS